MRERAARPSRRERLTFRPALTSMASMRRSLSTLLVCLLLCSALVTAFHHHEDGAAHSDCSICLVGHHQPATESDAPAVALAREFTAATFTRPILIAPTRHEFSPTQSRAPPL